MAESIVEHHRESLVSLPEYSIVVPSRKRPRNMETIRWLLPTAKICIDERELKDYAPFVEKSRLLIHPPLDGLPRVMNWMMDAIESEVFIEIDDDFQGVQVNVGSKRFITDSQEILAILENSMLCCRDLGLSTFCYSRSQNTTIIHPDTRPIVPVQAVCNAFGIMGAARHRHYDLAMSGRAPVDWTLRTLLEDRAILADLRFYFDCGRIFSGAGGNVGLNTPESFKACSKAILARWGKSVSFTPPKWIKNRDGTAMSIRVERINKSAQR